MIPGLAQGSFVSTPKGVILHGSRSGQDYDVQKEYVSTIGYVQRGTDGTVGWNATVGEDQLCEHIVPSMWGWNARGASKLWLAVEFAQSTADRPISDGQVRAFVWWFQNVAKGVYPNLPDTFVMHSELPEGIADGKTDVFARGSAAGDELRQRIQSQIAWFRSNPG